MLSSIFKELIFTLDLVFPGGLISSLKVISLLSMQKNWIEISSLLKRTERSDINSACGGSIFNLQSSIPACPDLVVKYLLQGPILPSTRPDSIDNQQKGLMYAASQAPIQIMGGPDRFMFYIDSPGS